VYFVGRPAMAFVTAFVTAFVRVGFAAPAFAFLAFVIVNPRPLK
jgi:hypothetical protein